MARAESTAVEHSEDRTGDFGTVVDSGMLVAAGSLLATLGVVNFLRYLAGYTTDAYARTVAKFTVPTVAGWTLVVAGLVKAGRRVFADER